VLLLVPWGMCAELERIRRQAKGTTSSVGAISMSPIQ
jgi:hypothetical protein